MFCLKIVISRGPTRPQTSNYLRPCSTQYILSFISHQISYYTKMAPYNFSIQINVCLYCFFIPQTAHLISGLPLTFQKNMKNFKTVKPVFPFYHASRPCSEKVFTFSRKIGLAFEEHISQFYLRLILN